MSQVKPTLSILTSDQIQDVHKQSLKLLETTGIRVDAASAREVFSRGGAVIKDDRITLPGALVEQAIASSPASIKIFNQLGEAAFTLGPGRPTIFGLGVTNTAYEDPHKGEILPFQREHIVQTVRLGNQLSEYDLVSTTGVIQDGDPGNNEIRGFLEMLANTSKPLVMLISDPPQFKRALDLLQHVYGEPSVHPFVIPYFNPITPLVLNADTTEKMMTTVDAGLPLIFSSYGMAGATTPITPAGSLVLLNAELLAGLVFAQLLKPGTPVILGSLPAIFDMRYMTSAYTSQTQLLNLACAEMMSHYEIPHAGTSGSGAGWGADLPASGALWSNHLLSCLGKVAVAPFVGGNFDSLVLSPEMLIYANEVIRQTRSISQGFELSEQTMGLLEIGEVGPGGSFFTAPSTLAQYLEVAEQHSRIWPGYSLEQWRDMGQPLAADLLKKQVLEIMSSLQKPGHHDDILSRGESWMSQS